MRVKIDKIRKHGFHFDAPLPAERLGELLADAGTGFKAGGEVGLALDLSATGERILVAGALEIPVVGSCDKCLAPVSLSLAQPVSLSLVPRSARTDAPEEPTTEDDGTGQSAGSFRLEEADEDVYEGDELDLLPILREQILLALPDYVRCSEGCKGLCPVCGHNLNEGECGCDRKVPDPRLAGLKDIKLS